MAAKTLRQTLLDAGVKALKGYGYPAVNDKNILTDEIYKPFFKTTLEGTIKTYGKNKSVVDECNKIIKELS